MTVIAVLAFIEAGFLAVAILGLSSLLIMWAHKPVSHDGIGEYILKYVLLLALAALQAAAGYGILRLKNWARLTTMVIQAFYGLGYLTQVITGNNPSSDLSQPRPETKIFFALLLLALSGWILYYLSRAHVKHAFGTAGL